MNFYLKALSFVLLIGAGLSYAQNNQELLMTLLNEFESVLNQPGDAVYVHINSMQNVLDKADKLSPEVLSIFIDNAESLIPLVVERRAQDAIFTQAAGQIEQLLREKAMALKQIVLKEQSQKPVSQKVSTAELLNLFTVGMAPAKEYLRPAYEYLEMMGRPIQEARSSLQPMQLRIFANDAKNLLVQELKNRSFSKPFVEAAERIIKELSALIEKAGMAPMQPGRSEYETKPVKPMVEPVISYKNLRQAIKTENVEAVRKLLKDYPWLMGELKNNLK